MHIRLLTPVLCLFSAFAAFAQPTAMTWDDEFLHVTAASDVVLYLDVDPRSTPTAGIDSNGNLTSTNALPLPFRADAVITGGTLMIRDGFGGWIAGDPLDLQVTADGFAIRWDGLPPLHTRPASFRWLSSVGPHFYNVASTETSTAFADVQSTWRVTSSLDDAITSANADATSTRRFITFEGTTLAVTSALPTITRTVTIDGEGEVTITGTSAIDGLVFENTANCVVTGLTLRSFDRAIVSNTGLTIGTNTITANGNAITAAAGDLLIRGNSIFANTTDIEIANAQPSPVVHAAVLKNNILTLDFSVAANPGAAAQSFQLDLYRAEDGQPKIYSARSPCFTGSSLTNRLWTVGGYVPTETGLVLMATSYDDANCTDLGDGTSEPVAFNATQAIATTTTLQLSTTTVWAGAPVTMTATVTSSPQVSGGKITFTDNGVPIPACTNMSGTYAQCVRRFSNESTHTIAASYTGDYAHADSASAAQDVTVGMHVFTGPGNFSDPSKWNSATLPGPGEHFTINGACTFDSGAAGLDYGATWLNSGATLTWPSNHNTVLSVTDISGLGGNNIDMAAGGTLKLRGWWNTAAVTLTAGQFSFVELAGTSQTLPALGYYNLRISGSVTPISGALVLGTFHVAAGGSFTASQSTVSVRGGIANAGTLTFADLTIIPGGPGPVSTMGSFNVAGTMTVNATLSPNVDDVITAGTLTGSGTVRVSGPSFGAQYAGAKTLTNLTVEFRGVAPQVIDSLAYGKLTLNNAYGATAGAVTVTGTLTLAAGVLTPSAHLTVSNPSPSAVVQTGGWVVSPSGQFRRQISAGTSTYLLPVGTETKSARMILDLRDVATSTEIKGSVFDATAFTTDEFESSGLDAGRRVNVIWRLDLNNVGLSTYDVKFHFESSGMIDGNAAPLKFKLRRRAPDGSWHSTTATSGETWTRGTLLPRSPYDYFAVGNQKVDHYELSYSGTVVATKTFIVHVLARDRVHLPVQDATGNVTMGSTGGGAVAQYDANGDGTFGDNVKALVNGELQIATRVPRAGQVTFSAADGLVNGFRTLTVPAIVPGDFNADGKSDLLWRNPTTGNTVLWRMNGLTLASSALLPAASAPRAIVAIADFDGDLDADVAWRNADTGEVSIWFMNSAQGGHVLGNSLHWVLGSPSAEWVLQGVGDFDGNARADLLWHNTSTGAAVVWLLQESNVMTTATVAIPSRQWSVQGIGDFDADGKADILWRNSVTKEAWAWLMNGSTIARTGHVATPSDVWSVKGVGDFSGDTNADIVWRNSETSDVVVWTMNGTSISGAGYTAAPPSEWDIQAVGDFDGNGNADMMWRNTIHGYNVIWLMNGTAISSSGYIDAVTDQNWRVAGPR